MKSLAALAWLAATAALFVSPAAHAQNRAQYESMVATHARANDVPEALVHRVIVRESKYHAHLVGRGGTIGLMQIKLATARSLGYTGDAAGLRDPDTNLAYGVKYLAGAYRAANGDHSRAVRYYASGYYYAAKRQRPGRPLQIAPVLASAPPQETGQPQDASTGMTKDAAVEAVAAPGEAAANPVAPAVTAKPRKRRKAVAEARALVQRPPGAVPGGAKAANPH